MEKHGEVSLLDADAQTFQIYVNFLYTGRLCTMQEEEMAPDPTISGDTRVVPPVLKALNAEWHTLCNCLVLADLLQDNAFHNTTMDTFVDTITSQASGRAYYPVRWAIPLYASLPAKSPAFQFFIDVMVSFGTDEWIEISNASALPGEF